jgi:hypothetical protein
VVIGSIGVDSDTQTAIAEQLGLAVSETQEVRAGHSWPAELRKPPWTYIAGVDARSLVVFDRQYGAQAGAEVHIVDRRATLSVESPIEFLSFGRRLIVRLRSPQFDKLPKRDVIAQRVIAGGAWRGNEIEVGGVAQPRYTLVERPVDLPHQSLGS